MKSRAPLVMMEQLVMVLVFALAAAVCVRIFALSDRLSLENETRDRAVAAVQNAANGSLRSLRPSTATMSQRSNHAAAPPKMKSTSPSMRQRR